MKKYYIKTCIILIIAFFTIIPLFAMFAKINSADANFILTDNNFKNALVNSLTYSFIASSIVIILATIAAYLLDRSGIRHRQLFVNMLTLALLIPSLSIGLGIKLLFGKNGFIDKLLSIKIDLLGMPALVICSIVALFPVAFNSIYDALQYENKNVYLASDTLGINRLSTFFRITLPYLKLPLIYTFFCCFSIIFSDYGIPMEVAGLNKTLPMYLYENMTASLNYGRSSIAMIVLILPAILLFITNLFLRHSSDKQTQVNLQTSKTTKSISVLFLTILSVCLFLPAIAFIVLAFAKSFPNDLTFTLSNFANAFNVSIGLTFTNYVFNSLKLALLTATIGTVFAFTVACFSVRCKDRLSNIIDTLIAISLCLPGMAIGICYVFMFNSITVFYKSIWILIVVNIVHMIGSPYLIAKNALSKQNLNYENIADTLGISRLSLFFKVIVPNSITSLLSMFAYLFITSMTTITAVLFLATYLTQPLAILIPYYEKNLNYEMQAVISVCILTINLFVKGGLTMLTNIFTKKSDKKNDKNKVERAIILAAGFGSRMQPLTFTTPKPLIAVNGKPMIETIIENLHKRLITDIIVVTGYKSEQFEYLIEKYDVKLIYNDKFNEENNISSLYAARKYIDRCYICEADLLLTKNVFKEYEDGTCFFGFWCDKTEDWCAKLKNGKINEFKIGGENVYQTCGISYWNYDDAKKLRKNLEQLYNSHGGKQQLWDMAAFGNCKYKLKVGINEIDKTDIIELDTVTDLQKVDKSYII